MARESLELGNRLFRTAPSISEIDLAMCRSEMWEALALGFRPPGVESVARLTTPEGSAPLADAAALLDASDGGGLAELVLELARPPARTLAQLRSDHARLFGHTAPGLERSDHVARECEFMLLLARKEAYALEADEADTLRKARAAARLFHREHLGRWVPAFGARLAREDTGGFYGPLGALAAAFVVAECVRTGVPLGEAGE